MATFLFLAGGLLLLYFGAEFLVRGGAALALKLGIAPLIVGLTVVAFGTSAPEMVVSVSAAVHDAGGIALGNIIGSNICNIALILGLAAVIRPMKVQVQLVRLDVPIMIGASLALVVMLADGQLGRIDGTLLAAAMATYLWFLISAARRDREALAASMEDTVHATRVPTLNAVLMVGAGLALLVVGGNLFVQGAVALAERLGMSQRVIGLTIIAVGTSLPELATSLVASWKGEGDLSIGNVVGSNIFNVLAILGVSATVHPLAGAGFTTLDYGAMLLAAAALLPLAWTGFRISRWEGGLLLAGYAVYVAVLIQP
ncbi:MAG: calcium/sodium antiporter [Rhodothermales bacterium]